MKKGVNIKTDGLSKGSLDLLQEKHPEIRAKYGDDGLLLDGTVDHSPLALLYPEDYIEKELPEPPKPQEKQEAQEEKITISPSELDALLDKKLNERLANQGNKPQAQQSQLEPQIVIQRQEVDYMEGVPEIPFTDKTYVLVSGKRPPSYNNHSDGL